MTARSEIPAERYNELKEMFDRGDVLAQIAAHFGVTVKVLRETIAALHLPPRLINRKLTPRSIFDDGRVSELLAAYSDATTPVQQILVEFGIPLARLYAELQKAGLPRRKKMPARTTQLEPHDKRRIINLYVDGRTSVADIAASNGLNYDQVYVVLREAGIALRTRKHDFRNDHIIRDKLTSLYNDDTVPVAEILLKLGITQHRMNLYIKELELTPRGKGGGNRSISPAIVAKLPEYARRYEAGESMAKLAKEAGIGLATMKVRLKKLRL